MRIALAVVGLLLVALLIFWAASEYIIRRDHRIAPVAIAVPHDAASIAEGARLATMLGCPSGHRSRLCNGRSRWTCHDNARSRGTLKIDDSLDVFAVHGIGGIL
eukprot:gene56795-biopygen40607